MYIYIYMYIYINICINTIHILYYISSLKLHEDWGSTPAAIDTCLRAAEKHDIQVGSMTFVYQNFHLFFTFFHFLSLFKTGLLLMVEESQETRESPKLIASHWQLPHIH